MSFNHVLTQRVMIENRRVESDFTVTGELKASLKETIPAGGDPVAVDFPLTIADVKSFFALSNFDLAFYPENGVSPAEQIQLKANVPYVWNESSYDVFKFTADATRLIVQPDLSADVLLQIEVLMDPTP